MSDSGFFTPDTYVTEHSAPELLHESDGGWSSLYLVDRDGKFRVLKALKMEFRGNVRYETLLRKEFEIGYKLSHPNLCEVYGFVEHEGLGHCIEMEWGDGMDLKSFLSGRKLSCKMSLKLIRQMCDAVSYCHSRQVIHRDIKPENIMITHSGNNLKLIDFGLSDSDAHSVFKSACGTVVFAAPELLDGAKPDVLSDIYSLGKVISLLHHSFCRVAHKCMRQERSRRYADVEIVKNAAERSMVNRRLFASLSVVAVVALLVFVVVSVGWQEVAPGAAEPGMAVSGEDLALSEDTVSIQNPVVTQDVITQDISLEDASYQQAKSQDVKPRDIVKPAQKAAQSATSEYDASDIDELFNMATDLLDNGQ